MADNLSNVPTVPIPADTDMALEPAMTIGSIFANKAMLQPVIAAGVAIISTTFKLTADDPSTLVDQITTIVMFLSMFWTAASAQWEARKRAFAQAETTREVVYAPQTVHTLVEEAATAAVLEAPKPTQTVAGLTRPVPS
jgi:hypothetical protein